MKYFVGYLIQGEAAHWHEQTAREIAQKFNTWSVHEHIPPHITIFRPFETADISSVKQVLEEWASRRIPASSKVYSFLLQPRIT